MHLTACQRPQKVLKISGDKNHAQPYHVTELLRSKGPEQDPQPVPSPSSDFKDRRPSQSCVCQDKICLFILVRSDTDPPLLKIIITVIRDSIIVTRPLCHKWLVF